MTTMSLRLRKKRGTHYAGENPFSTVLSPVPLSCITYFIDHKPSTLLTEGLFRVPGDLKRTAKLWRGLRKQKKGIEVMDFEPHEVASCFKEYFRSLSNPLCTIELYDCFVAAAGIPSQYADERRACLRKVLDLLPPGNYVLLKRLMAFLRIVASHASRNRMTTLNLALVFGPSILSPLRADMRAAVVTIDDLTESSHVVETISFLLDNFETLFYTNEPNVRFGLADAVKTRVAKLERSSESQRSIIIDTITDHSSSHSDHEAEVAVEGALSDDNEEAAPSLSSSSSSSPSTAAAASSSSCSTSTSTDPKLDRAKGVFDRALKRGTRVVTTSLEQFALAIELGVQDVQAGDEINDNDNEDNDAGEENDNNGNGDVNDNDSFYWEAKAKVDSQLGTSPAFTTPSSESFEGLMARSSLLQERLTAGPPTNDEPQTPDLFEQPLTDSLGSLSLSSSAGPPSSPSCSLLPSAVSASSSSPASSTSSPSSPTTRSKSKSLRRRGSTRLRAPKDKEKSKATATQAVHQWSVEEVRKWVGGLGHPKLDEVFAENDIDGEVLLTLTDADLSSLGVSSLGSRKKILLRIAALTVGSDSKEQLK